jgi:PAS domain S-box-containing protein
MSMQAREAQAYPAGQLRLLETLASQVASTVERLNLLGALKAELAERKRAEVKLEQRVNENYFLYNIGVLLSSAPNLIEVMQALAAELELLMPVNTFYLAYYDPATDLITFPLFLRDGAEVAIAPWKLHDRPSLSSEVITQKRTIYIKDVLDPETQLQHPYVPIGEMTIHAWLGVPLFIEGQVVGVMSVQSQQPDAYTREHIRLMEALAVQLSIATERTRLLHTLQQELAERKQAEQQAQRRAEQLATMGVIGMAVSTLKDLDNVLELIYQQVQRITAVDAFYIALYDQEHELISFPIMYDTGIRYNEPTIPLKPDTWIAQVIRSGEPFILHRTEEELAIPVKRAVGNVQRKSASILLVPLWLGQRAFGVLSIQSYTLNAYSAEVAEILTGIGRQVAIAIENAQLYTNLQQELAERKQAEEKIQRTATQLSMLNEIGRAVTALNSPENVLDIIRRQVERAIPLDAFNVYLYTPETNTLSYPYVYEGGQIWQEPDSIMKPGTSLSSVLKTGESVIRHLTTADIERFKQKPGTRVGDYSKISASFLFVPLINMGKVFGALSVQSYELNKYNADHLRLLEGVALQAATAIENARLFMGLQQELTERKQVELALRRSEAQLRAVIDQFPYDVWVCDADGRYILQNRAGEKSFPNIIGKTPLEYEHAPLELRQRWEDEQRHALNGELVHSGLFDEVVDGVTHSFIVTIAPISVDEKIIGLVGLSVDVSELRQAEEAVRKLNDELEQRVKDRTLQLEAANKELETFSYSVSHDLRAPLRGISGFGKILADDFRDQLDPRAQTFLDKILGLAREMNELIDSLLTLSRLNRAELRRLNVDLSAMAANILDQLRQADPGRAVTCRVAEGVTAFADAVLIRNVLENLLGNAWKYSSKTAQAEIEFGIYNRDHETVYFVRDNGAGFDMQYADKLFGAFVRLHGTAEFAGHGIGLATVQRIIHRHGGRIWAEAAVDKGATFYFTLGPDSDISLSI